MKTLSELLTVYTAQHWTAIDQAALAHLKRFVAFAEPALAAEPQEPEATAGAIETKTYPDGSTGTGPGPLPETSGADPAVGAQLPDLGPAAPGHEEPEGGWRQDTPPSEDAAPAV